MRSETDRFVGTQIDSFCIIIDIVYLNSYIIFGLINRKRSDHIRNNRANERNRDNSIPREEGFLSITIKKYPMIFGIDLLLCE